MPLAESIATLSSYGARRQVGPGELFLSKSLNVRLWCIMRRSLASSRLILPDQEKYLPQGGQRTKLERSQIMRREA
jgi:hypothetical protein